MWVNGSGNDRFETATPVTQPASHYKIAEAARLSGVASSTLRLWESQGLIAVGRTKGGQRFYTAKDIALIKRIVWLRQIEGLNAAAIRAALSANPAPRTNLASAPISANVGRKLRALRHAAGRTLKDVADVLGITASTLSTFERTSQGVSFKTLYDLAHHFGTTVSELSGERERDGRALVRSGAWRTWPRTTPGITVQVLAEGGRQMDCHRFVLASGASSEGAYGHEGEEFVHIIAGRLEISLDQSDIYDLHPGDSLYFESRRHHAWVNRHDGETILIWINTPPTF